MQASIVDLAKQLTILKDTKVDDILYQRQVEATKEVERTLKNEIVDVYNQLKSTDNYLEKYLPFNNFCQLFEVLRMALESEQIKKIRDYEEYRLKQLYEIILNDKGTPRTTFEKKYVVQPVSYTWEQLSGEMPKL